MTMQPVTQRLVFISLLVVLVAGWYAQQNWSSIANHCGSSGDFALTELEIQKAKSFKAYTGPYSRAQFRHPGPVNVYLYAAGKTFFPFLDTSEAKHGLTQLIISVVILLCGFAAAAVLFTRFEAGGVLLVILLFTVTRVRRDIFYSVWGPSTIVFPAFAFLLSSALVAHGRIGWIAVQLITATIITQTHVGGVILVAPVLIGSLCGAWFRRRQSQEALQRMHAFVILGGLLVCALAWVPTLYDMLIRPDWGNVGAIWRYLSSEATSNSLYQALDYLAGFYKSPIRDAFPFHRVTIFLIVVVCLVVLPLRHEPHSNSLRWLVVLGIACSFVGARGVDDLRKQYLMWWQYALVALAYFFVVSVLLYWLERLLKRIRLSKAVLSSVVTVLAATGALYLVDSAYAVRERECGTFYPKLLAYIAPTHDTLHLVSIEDFDQWQTAAGLVQRLYSEELPVCTKGWGFMFGNELVCRTMLERQSGLKLRKIRLYDPKRFSNRAPPSDAFVGKRSVVVTSYLNLRNEPKDQ